MINSSTFNHSFNDVDLGFFPYLRNNGKFVRRYLLISTKLIRKDDNDDDLISIQFGSSKPILMIHRHFLTCIISYSMDRRRKV